MKKGKILALGLLVAFVMVLASLPAGYAANPGITLIMQNRGHCPFPVTGAVCWVDPGNEQADCYYCCDLGYSRGGAIIDKYGCGCCCY